MYIYVCVQLYIYMTIYIYVYISIYVYIIMYIYVYMYIYICIYVYMYICVCVYIYAHSVDPMESMDSMDLKPRCPCPTNSKSSDTLSNYQNKDFMDFGKDTPRNYQK